MSDVLNVSSFGSDPVDDYVRRQIMMRLAEFWRAMDPVHHLSDEALVRLIRTQLGFMICDASGEDLAVISNVRATAPSSQIQSMENPREVLDVVGGPVTFEVWVRYVQPPFVEMCFSFTREEWLRITLHTDTTWVPMEPPGVLVEPPPPTPPDPPYLEEPPRLAESTVGGMIEWMQRRIVQLEVSKMAQVDNFRTKINKMGGLTIRNEMKTCRSFQEYNENSFTITQDAEGARQDISADPQELSALERGHRYYVTQVAEKRFRLESPYRIADYETAQLGAGCAPEPDDETLLKKYGDSARRWQAVRDKFYLGSSAFEMFKKRVEAIGGDFVMMAPDLDVLETGWKQAVEVGARAKDTLERIEALKLGLTQENAPEALPRITSLSKEAEPLDEAFGRARDVFMGQNVRLMESWGHADLKERSLKVCLPQIKEAELYVKRLKLYGPKLAIAAAICLNEELSRSKRVAGASKGRMEFETLGEALVSLRSYFPHFRFIKVSDDGDLLVEISTNSYARITRSGVMMWRPEVKASGGRIAFLEVDKT